MSTNESLASEWLDHEDRADRQGRLARLQWLGGLMPEAEYLAFPGGLLSKSLFEELRYCFAYGQYLATVILGLAFIERTLAAEFYTVGRNDLERANISTLLSEALALGWISNEEFSHIDKARTIRNNFTHFRRPLHDESVERRAVEQNILPYDVIEEDARHVVEVAFHVLARNAR